jgi:hypothetical protein
VSFDYNKTAQTADRLIKRFGASCTLKREAAGTYDPSTGASTVTTTSISTTAVVFAYEQGYIDNTLILQGDQRAYLIPSVEPKQGDKLTWQAKDYAIVSIKPLDPGTALMYEAQLRG